MDDRARNNSKIGNESARSSVTPGFEGGTGGGEAQSGLTTKKILGVRDKNGEGGLVERNDRAANDLGEMEGRIGDEGELAQRGDDLDQVRRDEEFARGYYSGGGERAGFYVGGSRANKDDRKSNKLRFSSRKWGPLTGIIIAIFGFGMVSFAGVSTEIISWKENLSSKFGQNSAVISRRSNVLLRKLLATNRSTTSDSIFGTKFKISSKLSQKLKEQNIHYVETSDANGGALRMLVYEDPDGAAILIVASDSDVSRANSLGGTEIDIDGRKVRLSDSSMTLTEAKRVNRNFNRSYDTATITFTGKIAGWFDAVADSMYKRIIGDGARNQTSVDDPTEEKVNDVLLGNKSQGIDDSGVSATKEIVDEDGKTKYVAAVDSDEVGDGKTFGEVVNESGKIDTDSPSSESVAKSLSARAQKVAMLGSSVGCAFLRGMGAISIAVGALQTANVINYASKYLEIADKIKSGDADEVTNIALNNLNSPAKTKAYDMNGNLVESEKAVTQSNGWNAAFTSANIIDKNSPGALMMNREYSTKNALRLVGAGGLSTDVLSSVAKSGGGIEAFRFCNGLQFTMGVADAVSDVILLVGSAGIGNFVKSFIKGAIQGAVLAAAMAAIGVVISLITPVVTQWFASKLGDVLLGDNGGYALQSGAQNILNDNLQMSTGRYASKENAIQVFGLLKDVEKQWAEYERDTKDPFDATSKYTFMGSLVNSILPIVNRSNNSIVSYVSSASDLVGPAIASIVSPSVSALNEAEEFAQSLSSEGNCGFLDSAGVAGDFACNKFSGAYVDEIETMDPDTVYNKMVSYGSFSGEDSEGNPMIEKKSEYAKFLVACVSNTTKQPGTMSAEVEGFIQETTQTESVAANALINFGTNFVPFGGILDSVDAAEQESNSIWNSGLACTGNTGDVGFDEKIKTFSMYNLDQRTMAAMGITDSNSSQAFLDEYYNEHPVDNSIEGVIAQFSGMSKEQASDALAFLEYIDFVNNYDPTERFAFGAEETKPERVLKFDNENVLAGDVVLPQRIVYADVRNRNFAV